MKATNADVTGKITANSGKIGGWKIENGNLTSGSMSITSGGSISGSNWSIDANGNASFGRLSGTLTGNLGVGTGGSFSGGSGSGAYRLGASNASLGNCGLGDGFKVGDQDNKQYIKDLAVNTLTADVISSKIGAIDVLGVQNITSSGVIRANGGFIASDGQGGVSAPVSVGGITLNFKNGLFVGTA
jgi:hypothetical protein